MGEIRLSSGQYLRPGAYIGFVFRARPIATTGLPRLPGYVAKGNRLARTSDFPIKRSFRREVELTFASLPPHIATLQYPAFNDKTGDTRLYKSNGDGVDVRSWEFRESDPGSGIYNQIEIELTKFDKNADYLVDYQSTSRVLQDEVDIPEMRDVIAVGDSEGSSLYLENRDFRIVTDVIGNTAGGDPDALIRDADNSDGTGVVSASITKTGPGGSTGVVAFNVATDYAYPYPLHYSLQCIAVTAAPTATFRLTITPLGGGNNLTHPIPPHPSSAWTFDFTITDGVDNINYQLDTNYAFTDGIRLDFNFGGGPVYYVDSVTPVLADIFDYDAIGEQLIEIASPLDNTNQFSEVSDPAEWGNKPGSTANTSSGNILPNADTNYDGLYNRNYYFEVLSIGAGPRTATILWSGWDEDPWSYGTINIDESNSASLTRVSLEDGIFMDLDFGVEHLLADAGDILVSPDATNLATANTLATEILTNFNQHDANTLVAAHTLATLHQLTAVAPTTEALLILFCADAFTQYVAHINDSTMHPNIDTVWTLDTTTAPTTLQGCINFLNDYKEKNNRHVIGVNFTAGDTWLMTANAEMGQYSGKDDRIYTLTATTVTAADKMEFQYLTDTLEGGWGNSIATLAEGMYLQLGDGITLAIRNFDPAGTLVQYAAGDIFTFTTINEDLVDWNLDIRTTESIPENLVRQDPFGRVTFVPLSFYVMLNETPTEVIRVKDAATGNPLSYVWVHDPAGSAMPTIMFATDPDTTVEVTYQHNGLEPTPGNTYFFSSNRLRALEEYDLPIYYPTRDDANNGLRPVDTTNDAWIMTDIAFDTSFFGCYMTQVRSTTEDDIFSDVDYRRAIEATQGQKAMTDLIVCNRFSVMGNAKLSVEHMSSPFIGGERLLWQGVPIGTPLGDANTPGSIVYTAKVSLQFFGDGPGRGRAILLANTWATRQIILEDSTPTTVTLDGSFIAGYAAARQAGFDSPVETLLRKDTASFSDMHSFEDQELTVLGDASALFFFDAGDGLFRFGESHTVDTGSPDVNEISAMTQKDYVTRRVRDRLDQNLIGLVPPSPAAGVIQIQSYLVEELGNIVSEGFVAPYGSENNPPTTREIDPDSDTFVYVDERDRRRYHMGYWFNILYPIKWIMGLYSVDSRFWDNRNNSSSQ